MDRGHRGTGETLALMIATALATLAVRRHIANHLARESSCEPFHFDSQDIPNKSNYSLSSYTLWQISSTGWKDIFVRTYQKIVEDRLVATAAGVVFYGLFAIFPAITALVSSYGLFADPSTISDNLRSLALMLPEGSFSIVQDQIARVLAKGQAALGVTFLISILVALWSANAGVKAVIDALNVVSETKEKRSFVCLNLMSLGFTVGALASMLLMLGTVVAIPLAFERLGLDSLTGWIVRVGRWPLLAMMLLIGLAALYRYGPSRTEARWQWLSVGAAIATFLCLVGSSLLSWYLANFGNYNATYGSLGAVIGLMTWMWMSAVIVLCGAELNSEIERLAVIDSRQGFSAPVKVGAGIAEPAPAGASPESFASSAIPTTSIRQ
jgi:membrane protein